MRNKNTFPRHFENWAAEIYVEIIKLINKRIIKKLLSEYKRDPIVVHNQKIQFRSDSLRSIIECLLYGKNSLTEKDLKMLERKFGRLDTSIKAFTANTLNTQIDRMKSDSKSKKQFKFNIEQNLDNPELMGVRESYVTKNIALCQALGNEYMSDIGQSAFNTFLEGGSLEDLKDRFQEITDISESKAEFWGRDQLGDVYSEYTESMHKAAGIERYKWHTVGDNHVRGLKSKDQFDHAQLNGKVFNWQDGASNVPGAFAKPGAKHPGDDYQCRCTAEPTEEPETDIGEFE